MIGRDTLNILADLRSKYGDIYGVYIGSELTIFLNGYEVIHEALVKHGTVFSKRPKLQQRGKQPHAIIFGNGASWKELRKFTLYTFHHLCFRKTGQTLEGRITEELTYFTEKLISFNNKDVDISHIVTLTFANVIYNILHGRRIGYDNAKFKWYLEKIDEAFKDHAITQVLNACFPFLRYLPGDLLREEFKDKAIEKFAKYYDEICHVNYAKYKPDDNDCFIDFWIAAKENNDIFQKENLWVVLNDLMAAGSETTATTLKWVILALVKYPNIQSKLQRKVDEVISKDKTPSVSDKVNLPYVEATILEALRFGSVVPLSVPHAVLHDTMFKGYKIPGHATILPNISSVHFDPDIFPEPNVFKPERFLNETETSITGNEKLIPFSLGPRSCLGETLAHMELFLYVTTLVQKLEFRAPDDGELPSLKGVFGLTRRPLDFRVNIRMRSKM
ncbi:cytochrome P450 2U1-like [Mercenaria mercenaria]|uniref:cytochrome P450 2U1-like n=1 Tax=Mercenaria mercenaria TaxID=6596 RepID=UPI001E1D6C40|nr:cytochrome P450 2U1-like [Mercenaria mercenaria]